MQRKKFLHKKQTIIFFTQKAPKTAYFSKAPYHILFQNYKITFSVRPTVITSYGSLIVKSVT